MTPKVKSSIFICFQYLILSYTLCCLEGTWHYLLSSEETISSFLYNNWPIETKGCSVNLSIFFKYEQHDLNSPLPLTIGQQITNSIQGTIYWIDFWIYIPCLRYMTCTGWLPVWRTDLMSFSRFDGSYEQCSMNAFKNPSNAIENSVLNFVRVSLKAPAITLQQQLSGT